QGPRQPGLKAPRRTKPSGEHLAVPTMVWSSRAFGKIKRGDLPPTSRLTRFGLPAAALTIRLPTSVEPVDVTLSMPALEESQRR
ncbi:MAG TPA: hypothetical protein VNS22_18930, partial [Geminicoccus sp.]